MQNAKKSIKFNFNKTPKHNAHATYFDDFLLSSLSLIEEMKQPIKTPLLNILPHLEGTHNSKDIQDLPSSSSLLSGFDPLV